MAANYDQPPNVEKRTRFFDGQYLTDQDFIDEQKYHVDRQRRHNRTLHIAGICDGLGIEQVAGPIPKVTVAPGTAIDRDGRQLVVAQAQPIDLPVSQLKDKIASLYLVYGEQPADPQKQAGIEDFSRWLEQPEIKVIAKGDKLESKYPPVLLAEITLDANGNITRINTTVREYSGLRLPGPNPDAPTLRSDASGLVRMEGGLSVSGKAGIGTTSIKQELTVNGRVYIENGVIQRGGDTITATSDLGLYSQVEGNHMRFVTKNAPIRFFTDGGIGTTARVLIDQAGNVGIGTPTPKGFQVNLPESSKGGNAPGAGVTIAGGDSASIELRGTGTPYIDFAKDAASTDYHARIRLTDTDKLALEGANVGIGTSDPKSRLAINSKIAHDGGFSGFGDAQLTIFDPNHNGGSSPNGTRDILHLVREGVSGQAYGNKVSLAIGRYEHPGNTASRTQLDIKLTDASFNTHNTVMTLQSNGNVGIGTSDPKSRLAINSKIAHDGGFSGFGDAQLTIFDPNHNGGNNPNGTRDILHLVREGVSGQAYGNKVSLAIGRYEHPGNTASRTQLDIKLTDASFNTHNTVMTLQSNGNVGIGTATAPKARLEVVGGAIMPAAGNAENAGILFPKDPGAGAGDAAWIRYYARSGEATTLEIGTSNDADDHIALLPSGNVGIGLLDPAARLHSSVVQTANILRLDTMVRADTTDVTQGIHLFKKGSALWGWKIEASGATDATARLKFISSQAGTDVVRLTIERNTGNIEVTGSVMERLDVIACGGRGDWNAANHPIMLYFKGKLTGKPIGTYLKAIQDNPGWRGHYWQGWVDADGKIRVIHNNINTGAVVT